MSTFTFSPSRTPTKVTKCVLYIPRVCPYILEILGQKWRALRNHLALRNRQNLVLGKKIIKSRLRLVRFLELLLKIPDGSRGGRDQPPSSLHTRSVTANISVGMCSFGKMASFLGTI